MKHNKIKNTGIIFEILCNKIVSETLNPKQPQYATKILKRYFKNGTLLNTELNLYRQLTQKNIVKEKIDPDTLIDIVLEQHSRINQSKLGGEKYSLVRTIKESYGDSFFDSRVSDYKLHASIFNVLNNIKEKNPTEYLQCKHTIKESLMYVPEIEQTELTEDLEIQKLTLKFLIEKFNSKYSNIIPKQRVLLQKYINEDTADDNFVKYIKQENESLKLEFYKILYRSTEPTQREKISEIINLLDTYKESKVIQEKNIETIYNCYELIDEINKTSYGD